MKSKTLRILVPIAVILIVAVGFIANTGIGNLSSIGWKDISILCPLGALTTMLASKTIVPKAVISLVIGIVLILVLGRLFCGWICPVPVINKIPQIFKKPEKSTQNEASKNAEGVTGEGTAAAELTKEEKALLKGNKKGGCAASKCASCSSCLEVPREKFDSRHLVLIGALLSATIFGFPVFCLICPIGLTFATVFLVIGLFATGDITWSLIVVPVVLILEVLVFRKWCGRICPLSALMSLLGKLNSRTLRPTVETTTCIEHKGGKCGKCAQVCEVGINPAHPELGVGFNECLKCKECVDVCPTNAISMPLFPKKSSGKDTESAQVIIK
jgi:ferredoxin-type protein NapH